MLEISDMILRQGYTIFISKKKEGNLQGSYLKYFADGLHPDVLQQSQLRPFIHLPNILEQLEKGSILQVNQSGYYVYGILGEEKTEGPYCESQYLEVIAQNSAFSYYEMLIDLDNQLAAAKELPAPKAGQYIKLYKGVERYE